MPLDDLLSRRLHHFDTEARIRRNDKKEPAAVRNAEKIVGQAEHEFAVVGRNRLFVGRNDDRIAVFSGFHGERIYAAFYKIDARFGFGIFIDARLIVIDFDKEPPRRAVGYDVLQNGNRVCARFGVRHLRRVFC